MLKTITAHITQNWNAYFPASSVPQSLRPLFMRADKWNTVFLFSGSDSKPSCVIEIASGRSELLSQAAVNMQRVSSLPGLSQFCPKLFYFGKLGNEDALIQEFCHGLPILFKLNSLRFGIKDRYILLASDLLLKVHSGTRRDVILSADSAKNHFAPLLTLDKDGKLSGILREIENKPLPLVLSHNDFIPSNILVDDKDRLKILDWEYAAFDSLPLTDLLNFLVWAYRDMQKKDDKLYKFFKPVFLSRGSFSAIASKALKSYCKGLGIGRNLALTIFLFWAGSNFKGSSCFTDSLSRLGGLFEYLD